MTEQRIKILPDKEVYDRYEINTSIDDYRQLVELVIKRNIVAEDFLKALRRVMPYLEVVPQWLIDADTEITRMRDMTMNTIAIWKNRGVVTEKEGCANAEERKE